MSNVNGKHKHQIWKNSDHLEMHYIETKHTCLRDQIIPHYRQAGA